MSDFNAESFRSTPSTQPKSSGLALASLICGVSGVVLPLFFNSIAAVITGSMAKKEINASNGTITGGGMATAGLILGWIQIALFILAVVVIAVLAISAPSLNNIFNQISSTLQP
jgi:hypothetical protein